MALSQFDIFLKECLDVCFGKTAEITDLRKRAAETELSIKNMKLAAEGTSVLVVRDGNDLKVVPY